VVQPGAIGVQDGDHVAQGLLGLFGHPARDQRTGGGIDRGRTGHLQASPRSWAYPRSRVRYSSARNASAEPMVLAVIRGYSIRRASCSRARAGRSATSTLSTAVQCTGTWPPTREYMRTACRLSTLST